MKRFLALLLVFSFFPLTTHAEEAVTRRDGFLTIWESILRPAFAPRETPFLDVPSGSRGFREITYAKQRGLLDDAENFRPDEPLAFSDAMIFLLRTRNVDEPSAVSEASLLTWLEKYPVMSPATAEQPNPVLTSADLTALINQFDQLLRDEVHEISFYSEKFHGDGTAFGETFDMYAMTAAHRTFPHNTLVRVTSVENGKSVVVRINDRGPFVKGRDMDLSLGAFTSIAERARGKINARFERLGDATLAMVAPSSCVKDAPLYQRVMRRIRLEPGVPHRIALGDPIRIKATDAIVVRAIRLPDNSVRDVQDWLLAGEEFTFTPSAEGRYTVILGTKQKGRRALIVDVERCKGA